MDGNSQTLISQILGYSDFIILIILLISVLISFWRGFLREALSLTTWVAAFWVSISFHSQLAQLLTHKISTPGLRLLVAFAALFLGVFIAGSIISHLVIQLIKKTGFGGTDRLLGAGFGLLRGVLIVALGVMAGEMLQLNNNPAWQSSVLLPWFEQVAGWLQQFIPHSIAMIGD